MRDLMLITIKKQYEAQKPDERLSRSFVGRYIQVMCYGETIEAYGILSATESRTEKYKWNEVF